MRRAVLEAGSASDTLIHTFILFAGRTGRGKSTSVGQLTGRQNARSSHTAADTTAVWRTPFGAITRRHVPLAVTLVQVGRAPSAVGRGHEGWCGGGPRPRGLVRYTNREGEIGKMGASKTVASVGCIARSQGRRVAGPWNRIVSATMARVRNLRRAHGIRCAARVGGAAGERYAETRKIDPRSKTEKRAAKATQVQNKRAKNAAATLWKAV
jgi:hypothetical protein